MKNKILKEIVSAEESQNLIFVSRYFDFIALRNYFSRNNYSFDYCSEHSTVGDNSRARTNFLNGKTQFLIITERFYFFRRLRIRGIRNLLFFDLPLNSHFYNELVDAVNADGNFVQTKAASVRSFANTTGTSWREFWAATKKSL
ncbi:hypothetical protein MHBO_001858 [Bonamia ostreae]|uniref:UTP25 C-terminal domain-containing protein n=1 Tax=Bonamia ostreae TaxID=126728 RepID=A0ABV2AKE0_9EUKA